MKILVALLFSILAAVPALAAPPPGRAALANNYWSANTLWVRTVPGQPGTFEVYYKPRAAAPDYWCSAGDYVRRFVSQAGTTEVYLVRGLGQGVVDPKRRSVIFTTAPSPELAAAAAQPQGMTMNVSRVGQHYSASHGWSGCRDSMLNLGGMGLR